MIKWIALLLGTPLAVAILVLLIVAWIENRQARELAGKQPYAPTTTSASRTAVVYFSRSGNTALAARHIAMRLDAQLFPLEAPASGVRHFPPIFAPFRKVPPAQARV